MWGLRGKKQELEQEEHFGTLIKWHRLIVKKLLKPGTTQDSNISQYNDKNTVSHHNNTIYINTLISCEICVTLSEGVYSRSLDLSSVCSPYSMKEDKNTLI